MRLALLLCLAAVCGSAAAVRSDLFDAAAGRALLQTATCDSIPNCATCHYQFFQGTVTRAICDTCAEKYAVKSLGTACWCAAGYYKDLNTDNLCNACDYGYWCAGSKSTFASAIQVQCGAFLTTPTQYATSDRECLVQAGYSWSSSGGEACAAGFYNPGNNNRKCSKCPGGLSWSGVGDGNATSSAVCVAPPGYYYLQGKAVACAQGSWKSDYANADCTLCPTGVTTAAGETGKTSADDCKYILPGYFFNETAGSYTAGTTEGTLCPADTYRSDLALYGSAKSCTDCLNNMRTPPSVSGATSINDCLAPPGWGYTSSNPPTATACPDGKYKAGWNREACKDCGTGFKTDVGTDGAKSADECYIRPGWGASQVSEGVFRSDECPINTYGSDDKIYGLAVRGCTECVTNMFTNGTTANTNESACVTQPGYGYSGGESSQCAASFYNAGYNKNPCTQCVSGRTTASAENATTAAVGATSIDMCYNDKGYQADASGNPKPCAKGSYKDVISNTATCTTCRLTTTTSKSEAATAATDCDTCVAGFGASGPLNGGACTICPTGEYGRGTYSGAHACDTCTTPVGYTGTMVSRRGISSQDECMQQFPTSDTVEDNNMPWDILSVTNTSVFVSDAAATMTACQGVCAGAGDCVYFQMKISATKGECNLLKAKAAISTTAQPAFPGAGTEYWLAFKVKNAGGTTGYVTYEMADADHATVGDTLTGSPYGTYELAKTACTANAGCAGFNFVASGQWRTFAGKTWLNYMGKVKTYGPAFEPWTAEPTGLQAP